MTNENYCAICDCKEEEIKEEKNENSFKREEQEEVSFAVLLALVPAMTMTLFNLMGLI